MRTLTDKETIDLIATIYAKISDRNDVVLFDYETDNLLIELKATREYSETWNGGRDVPSDTIDYYSVEVLSATEYDEDDNMTEVVVPETITKGYFEVK